MKHILLIVAIGFSYFLTAQKTDVESKLIEYGITSDALDHAMKDAGAVYSFNLKTTTESDGKTDIEESHFAPNQPVGSKWILDSHNGNAPSKKQLKNFDKVHNTKVEGIDGKVDDTSWKILTDDESIFTISFSYDKSSLPKKYQFLGDCTGTAVFNKKTKSLEKVEFVNNVPLHIKFFNVSKLNMVVTYIKFDGKFVMETETIDMTVDMLGQSITVKEKMEYTNYKKVK